MKEQQTLEVWKTPLNKNCIFSGTRMSNTAEPFVLHARVPDREGSLRGPRLPRLHPTREQLT